MSHDAPSVSTRNIYGSTAIHDDSATIHHSWATNTHDASKIRYGASTIQAGSAMTSSSCCILDESWWIGAESGVTNTPIHLECPRMTNGHDYTYGTTTNEPDAATVELRFRPHPGPQSCDTTIHPECFKRFKTVVVLSWRFPSHQDSSRITTVTVLLRFMPMSLRCYYESCRCITI